jgi:mannose-6-phosphate isomerase
VLRAGLTPKPRDVKNLVGSLTYTMSSITKHIIRPKSWGGGADSDGGSSNTICYDPPIPEFSILYTHLRESETEHQRGINGPSIAIVTKGRGELTGKFGF